MLCFLPPVPAFRPPPPDPGPRRPGRRVTGALVLMVLGLAGLTPIGWAYNEPQYSARAGMPFRFGPRPEEVALRDALASRHAGGSTPHFRAGDLSSVPPGLTVDSATGALNGTPSLSGTYTLALAVEDGRDIVSGRAFRLKVLPPGR